MRLVKAVVWGVFRALMRGKYEQRYNNGISDAMGFISHRKGAVRKVQESR